MKKTLLSTGCKIFFYDVQDDGEFVTKLRSIPHEFSHRLVRKRCIQIRCSIRSKPLCLLLICCCNLVVVDAYLVDLVDETVHLPADLPLRHPRAGHPRRETAPGDEVPEVARQGRVTGTLLHGLHAGELIRSEPDAEVTTVSVALFFHAVTGPSGPPVGLQLRRQPSVRLRRARSFPPGKGRCGFVPQLHSLQICNNRIPRHRIRMTLCKGNKFILIIKHFYLIFICIIFV